MGLYDEWKVEHPVYNQYKFAEEWVRDVLPIGTTIVMIDSINDEYYLNEPVSDLLVPAGTGGSIIGYTNSVDEYFAKFDNGVESIVFWFGDEISEFRILSKPEYTPPVEQCPKPEQMKLFSS